MKRHGGARKSDEAIKTTNCRLDPTFTEDTAAKTGIVQRSTPRAKRPNPRCRHYSVRAIWCGHIGAYISKCRLRTFQKEIALRLPKEGRDGNRTGRALAMDATDTSLDALVRGRRTIEQAYADLVAKFARDPDPELARMIRDLELEITERRRRLNR